MYLKKIIPLLGCSKCNIPSPGRRQTLYNKTPAKAFTPPAEKKIGTNVIALPIDCSGVVKSRPLLPYRIYHLIQSQRCLTA